MVHLFLGLFWKVLGTKFQMLNYILCYEVSQVPCQIWDWVSSFSRSGPVLTCEMNINLYCREYLLINPFYNDGYLFGETVPLTETIADQLFSKGKWYNSANHINKRSIFIQGNTNVVCNLLCCNILGRLSKNFRVFLPCSILQGHFALTPHIEIPTSIVETIGNHL